MEKKKYQFRVTVEKELVDKLFGHKVSEDKFYEVAKAIANYFRTDGLYEEIKYWSEQEER